MIFINDMKDLRLYKKQFFLPMDPKDKKHGNMVSLLTPSKESTVGLINHPLIYTKQRQYQSYYMDNRVGYLIRDTNEAALSESSQYVRDKIIKVEEEDPYAIESKYDGYWLDGEDDGIDNTDIPEWYSDLKTAIENCCDRNNDHEYTIYVKDDDESKRLGKIIVHWISMTTYDYDWSEYPSSTVSEACNITVSGYDKDIEAFPITNADYSTIVDSLNVGSEFTAPDISFTVIPYIHKCNIGISPDGKISADIITKKAFNEIISDGDYKAFVKDTIEFILKKYTLGLPVDDEAIQEKATKLLRYDTDYLYKHLKYVANKSKYRFNKLKKSIVPSVNTPQVQVDAPSIELPDKDSNPDEVEEANIIFEGTEYDAVLRKILYKNRLKKATELKPVYEYISSQCPMILYTYYTGLHMYKRRNLYLDLYYYNDVFFSNNYLNPERSVKAYGSFLTRLLNREYEGYTNNTVLIPVLDWSKNTDTRVWLYKEGINPISIIYRLIMTRNIDTLREIFGDKDLIFMGNKSYFRLNFSHFEKVESIQMKFRNLIDSINKNSISGLSSDEIDDTSDNKESKDVIVHNIADKLENRGIHVLSKKNLVGDIENPSADEAEEDELDQKRKELLDSLEKKAENSENTEEALDDMDEDSSENERIKELIVDLASREEDSDIQISKARSARMDNIHKDFVSKKIGKTPIKEILDTTLEDKPIQKSNIPVSINQEQWKDMSFVNFDRQYNHSEDIIRIVDKLSKTSYPLNVLSFKVVDNSTSEDYIDLYTIKLEDFAGRRYTLKFDLPKFRNGYYLFLRGNKKTIQNQFANMPIIKTDQDTCQIITNYNKIFIYRKNTATGKSMPAVKRILKAFNTVANNRGWKIVFGDCSNTASKYNLPIDYIDISSVVYSVETSKYKIYFDQDSIYNDYPELKEKDGTFPFAYNKETKSIVWYNPSYGTFGAYLYSILYNHKDFVEAFNSTPDAVRYTYSSCRIMNHFIPLILVCAYSEGLNTTLKKANISYTFTEKLSSEDRRAFDKGWIRFDDGYIVYDISYYSSLLMNGLKLVNTESVSFADVDRKSIYLDFLDDINVPRIVADGLENFYDLMIDPITEDVLNHYKLPTDYCQILLYANNLLSDNKYIRHTDSSSRRLRRQELISVKAYKAIASAYADYGRQVKHSKTNISFPMKQSAVIDLFMDDSTSSDASVINALNDVETLNSVTYKGESGLNCDRSYSLDKRTFDESMINVLGMSTGFAGNVGINRVATVDANVVGNRGYVNPQNNTKDMNSVKTLSATEAMTPFGTNHDDPFRTAMTFIQTAKHNLRVKEMDPLLITNGADEAMPYMVSDEFCFRAKRDGNITYMDENSIVITYKDGTTDYVDISGTIKKNSDGGFYVPMKLEPAKGIHQGKSVKANTIIAYDPNSFSNKVGETDNLAYNIGRLTKIAIMSTDEGFEDSTIISEQLCEAMSTDIIDMETLSLDKTANIYNLVKVGTHVNEGDTLLIYQDAYDDKDAQSLLKALTTDEGDISELGRRTLKSTVEGFVAGIKIYRTVEINELSDSLQKVVKAYEAPIRKKKALLNSKGVKTSNMDADYKLPRSGKLKNVDGIYIEVYLQFHDILKPGNKVVYDRAQKGVIKSIIPAKDAPTTDLRPNEPIMGLVSAVSFDKRMCVSPFIVGSINKLLIEMDRSIKDILEIPYDDSKI